jgi:hypothetical protein
MPIGDAKRLVRYQKLQIPAKTTGENPFKMNAWLSQKFN